MSSDGIDQIVVIGSSAGGIEALSRFVATLPLDFPAPVVLAQHIQANRASHLEEILAKHTGLPVRTTVDNMPLENGVVFVVPANKHVEVGPTTIRLRDQDGTGPRPSIDRLLSSAAESFGEGTIAVILTGTGSDGAAAAVEVKRAGGTIVIQDPATASYPALPRSLPPSIIDITANIDEIGSILYSLLGKEHVAQEPDEEQALRTIIEALRSRHGVDFSDYRQPTLRRRLRQRMVATDSNSIVNYLHYLQRHPEEYQRLISSFLIKVTEFFRDPETFAYIREHILPDLVSIARTQGNELRLWSAGCATGEEAYSLAILVAEILGDELDEFHVRVFATDLDEDAIEFARRGVYPAAALANLSPEMVSRYFTHLDGDLQIKKRVRNLAIFGRHDLGDRAPFPRIDLLLCRNVLIYFTTEMQRRVLQLITFSLRNGGYLVLGKAETTSPLPEYFVSDSPLLKVYRRRGDRTILPPGHIDPLTSESPSASHSALSGAASSRARSGVASPQRRTTSRQADSILARLPVGIVTVDRRYDIHTINHAARQMLRIHGSAIGDDLLHLIRDLPTGRLRTAIDAAYGDEKPEPFVETIQAGLADFQNLQLTCYLQTDDPTGNTPQVVVVIENVTNLSERTQDLLRAQAAFIEADERAEKQIDQLAEQNRRLLEANRELTTANTELRSTNEEFFVGNEELQASTEEIETLNEELQATNEELETLNEELQATVEELNTTNDDLQARSVDLQNLAQSLETERTVSEIERQSLLAVISSLGDGILVVDTEGDPLLTNEQYTRLLESADGVTVDEQGQTIPLDDTLRRLGARGEPFRLRFSIEAPDGHRRYFEANGKPAAHANALAGSVVTVRDITDWVSSDS